MPDFVAVGGFGLKGPTTWIFEPKQSVPAAQPIFAFHDSLLAPCTPATSTINPLDVALRTKRALAGLVLLSGTHIAADEWAPLLEGRKGLRVFQSHGQADAILPFSISSDLKDTLKKAGFEVTWVPFHGGHGIPPEVLAALSNFLRQSLHS